MKWLFYTLFFFTLISCVEFKQSEYIEKIDASLKTLNQAQLKLADPIFDSIPNIILKIKGVKKNIKSYLRDDTLSLEIAIKIDEINQVQIQLIEIEKKTALMLTDLNKLSLNFENLKKDINNGSGDRAKYNENIEVEIENKAFLVDAVEKHFNECTLAVKLFNKTEKELKLFSKGLELKNEE